MEVQITKDTSDQWFPAIYEDIVVWHDYRNGKWDIYGYNLSTKENFPITEVEIKTAVPYDSSELYLAIYGDIIVRENYKKGN